MWKLLVPLFLVSLLLVVPLLAGCAQLPHSLDPAELGHFLGQAFHYYNVLIQSALGREIPSACR